MDLGGSAGSRDHMNASVLSHQARRQHHRACSAAWPVLCRS